MQKIILLLACIFTLLINYHIHAMNDSRRFGKLTIASIALEDCSKIEEIKKLKWPGGDPKYSINRTLAAIVLRQECDQKVKDYVLYQGVLFNDYYLTHDALEHGANPNHNHDAIHILFTAKSIDIVKLLVAKGALLKNSLSALGFTLLNYPHLYVADYTLLHTASAYQTEPAVLEYYIQNAGIPINSLTMHNETPLHTWAETSLFTPSTRSNTLAKLTLLLNAKVNCEVKNTGGKTALDILERQELICDEEARIVIRPLKALLSAKIHEQQTGNLISQEPQSTVQDPQSNPCGICREEMQLTQNTVLTCMHTYCTDCINQWFAFKGQRLCPLCSKIDTTPHRG